MLPAEFDYIAPDSLEEALEVLAEDPDATVLAGGQSLIPLLKQRLAHPSRLVDLRRLDGLRYVREAEGGVAVGALTPHAEVAASELLVDGAAALAQAARAVGDAQVRNRGTLGGSLAHSDPAADLPAAVLALDATLVARSAEGEREIPARDFFLGVWTNALEPGEVLTEVRFPVPSGSRGAYRKLRQKASGFALVGAAAVLELDGEACSAARVAVTGAGSAATRLPAVEEALVGGPVTEERAREACEGAGQALDAPQDDVHASADYRRAMTDVYARRAVLGAVA